MLAEGKTVGMEESKPHPRSGMIGLWDRFVGPGATTAENTLILFWGSLGGAAIVAYALWADLGWSPLQLAAAAFVAFDIAGGVPANASSSAKRWYHRPGQDFRNLFSFPLVHVHPFVLALLFSDFGWVTAAVVYAYLLVAVVIVLLIPLYLKRPLALVLYCVALLASLYALVVPRGLEWFAPLFFLKLLVAHLLPEVPYRSYKGEAR
jgi:hypothetical protein